ncbi:MAG: hypothetical protein H0T80_06780 [Betaproteobacteria bacterium]|nr:hypothetical protein [Betaproteobacteria bacterium]
MGHVLFLILHVLAILFGMILLFLTIPLHLIYSIIGRRPANAPRPDAHVRCPDCKEFVLNEANVCKHCGTKLMPQSKVRAAAKAADPRDGEGLSRFLPWEMRSPAKPAGPPSVAPGSWPNLKRDVLFAAIGGVLLVMAIVRAFAP